MVDSDKASPDIDQIPLSIHIDNTNKLYNFPVQEYALSPTLYKKRFFPFTSRKTYIGKQPTSDIMLSVKVSGDNLLGELSNETDKTVNYVCTLTNCDDDEDDDDVDGGGDDDDVGDVPSQMIRSGKVNCVCTLSTLFSRISTILSLKKLPKKILKKVVKNSLRFVLKCIVRNPLE